MARFEEEQIVAGYTVRLDESFNSRRMRTHKMIKTVPRAHREVEWMAWKKTTTSVILATKLER